MNRNTPVLVMLLFVVGCANSPLAISMMSPDGLKQQESADLCNAWANSAVTPSSNIFDELVDRNELTPDEWEAAGNRKIFIGMSELALVCSWGFPTTINESNYGDGIERQLVYRRGVYSGNQYVYTKRGKIEAWN